MQLTLLYKASQKLKITPSLPNGKSFGDIEEFCIVLKSDLGLSNEQAELNKSITGSGVAKDNDNNVLVVSISVSDFDDNGPKLNVAYQIGYAVKFTGDDEWYKNPNDYNGFVKFDLARINK